MKLHRLFLLILLGCLSATALGGIVGLVLPGSWRFGEYVIATLLTVAFFSLTSLGAVIMLEKDRWRLMMIAALTLTAFGVLLYLSQIWLDWANTSYSNDNIVKVNFGVGVWAVALPAMGLLALPRFSGVLVWLPRATIFTIFSFAVFIVVAMIFEPDDDIWGPAVGVLSILTALGAFAVPIMAKVHKIDKLENVESTTLQFKLTCPRCLLEQTLATGHSRCRQCRLKFNVEIEEPRCSKCNYLLHNLTVPVARSVAKGCRRTSWRTRPTSPIERWLDMPRRKALKGIASGILGSFISRNNSVDGYWGIGKLCLFAKESQRSSITISLLGSTDSDSYNSTVVAVIAGHYGDLVQTHLHRAGIVLSRVRNVEITVAFGASGILPTPPLSTWGSPFLCTVEITDDLGRVWSVSRSGRCAPHDPNKELKRVH